MAEKGIARTHHAALIILSFLPMMITLAVLPFLPDTIPAHYSISGEVDRWGSRYESLILPAIAAALGMFLVLVTKASYSMDSYAGRLMLRITAGTLIFMTVLTVILLYMSLTYSG
ncbi:MAG: DUF1648 domain-containing protein [Methanomassiliicoccaceae archaeon]|jgi:hypothetical protein|nr:DUF1648 domain-containing protein [Methanomassiliicoccaceae archaeon]